MQKETTVSVVIPVYNAKHTLHRALESVYMQSHQPHEVLCIDDGSTDNTQDIAASFLADGRLPLHWIRTTNQGPAAARNRGIDQAQGRFVAFLDADDAWHPEKLRLQTQTMLKHRLDLLGGHSMVTGAEIWNPPQIRAPLHIRTATLAQALLSNPLHTSSVMLQRLVTLRFPSQRRCAEDYALWLELIATKHRCAIHSEALSAMFKRPYGQSGLSAALWRMQLGELAVLLEVGGRFNPLATAAAIPWSCLKFVRRQLLARCH